MRRFPWSERILPLAFLMLGSVLGAFSTRIPDIAAQAGTGTAQVALSLSAASLVSVVLSVFIRRLIRNVGPAMLIRPLGYTAGVVAVVAATSSSPVAFLVGVTLQPVAISMWAMVLNGYGAEAERRTGQVLLFQAHGLSTAGMLLGALSGALAGTFDISPMVHVGAVALVSAMVIASAKPVPSVVPTGTGESAGAGSEPSQSVLWRRLRGPMTVATIGALVEGIPLGWAALYLTSVMGASAGVGALAYAGFVGAMMTARLTAPAFVDRWGVSRLMRTVSWSAATIFAVAVLVDNPVALIVGFTALGLSSALVIPAVYSAAGRVLGDGSGAPIMATSLQAGFFVGPLIIGGLTDVAGLQAALLVLIPGHFLLGLAVRLLDPPDEVADQPEAATAPLPRTRR